MEVIEAGPSGARLDIICGECVAGMDEGLAPGSVDVVVTSPPYNLGAAYSRYDDTVPREEYLAWTEEWTAGVARVLAEEGSFFLNVGAKPSDPWVALQVAQVAGRRFALQNVIHWVKSIAVDAEDMGRYPGRPQGFSVGHYKPINSPRYLNDCHEYIFHFTKTGAVPLDRLAVGVPYQDKTNVARWKSEGRDRRCRGNVWFIPYRTILSRDRERPHPATFPARLPEMCLKLHGLARCRRALDPFLGLGATAVACARLGVDFTGFEIDEAYWREAVERVRQSASELP